MADVTFIHNSAGYVELMKSGAMRGVLKGYGSAIQGAAEGALSEDKGTPLESAPYTMHEFTGRDRAGVRVQTHNRHADYAELKHGILQGAAGV